ncbi:MAG: 5-methyltetrahydropteroyltriglutamate--homocysteine S-methyltransferase [Xanthobacteraceae bacterium]
MRPSSHIPPFKADIVGSLLRPQHLVDARKQYRERAINKDELRKVEDDAIREVVTLQESVGLQVVTDGEFRRQSYIIDFYFKVFGKGGIGFEPGLFYHRNDKGERLPIERMVVQAKARWNEPIVADHFAFLRSVTTRTPKITLPSPVILHFLGGSEAVLRGAYSSLDSYWADIVDVYRREIAALHGAGCRYLQIDETSLVKFGDPEIRSILDQRGDDWRALADSYVDVLNAVLTTAPADMSIAVHVCRGNRLGYWQADTGYEFMADAIFRKMRAPFYLLEFDSPRAGSLDALKFIPDGKGAVLGLVTTKNPALESIDDLTERVREATKYMPLDRLAISPQCGFSGDVRNRAMTIEQQTAKLRLVVDAARQIWGSA